MSRSQFGINIPSTEELLYGKKSKKTKRKRLSRTDEKAIFQKHTGICAICGKKTAFDYGEVDHIKSLAKGGSNRASNLQWLCHRCNKLKGSKRTNAQVKKLLGIEKTTKRKTTTRKTTKKKTKRKKKPKSPFDDFLKPPKEFKF